MVNRWINWTREHTGQVVHTQGFTENLSKIVNPYRNDEQALKHFYPVVNRWINQPIEQVVHTQGFSEDLALIVNAYRKDLPFITQVAEKVQACFNLCPDGMSVIDVFLYARAYKNTELSTLKNLIEEKVQEGLLNFFNIDAPKEDEIVALLKLIKLYPEKNWVKNAIPSLSAFCFKKLSSLLERIKDASEKFQNQPDVEFKAEKKILC